MTWANIPDFPGYQASSEGEVRSSLGRKLRILKPFLNPRTGYLQVCLRREGKTHVKTIHVLVALAFLGPRPWNMEVCHYDGNPVNNSLLNLDYDTHASNMQDMVRHGRSRSSITHCKNGHEYTPSNTGWKHHKNGSKQRRCNKCNVIHVARWRRRRANGVG